MALALLGFGGNLGDREQWLTWGARQLIVALKVHGDELAQEAGRSDLYETEPVGVGGQSDYLNGVLAVRTHSPPTLVLAMSADIEQQAGPRRKGSQESRRLDIDLLLYDDCCLSTRELTLPHPRMWARAFVLRPLLDLKRLLTPDVCQRATAALEEIGDRQQIRRYGPWRRD